MSGGRLNLPEEQWAAIVAAAAERLGFVERIRREVWIGPAEYTHALETIKYGDTEGLACVCEAVFSEALPEEAEGKRFRVLYYVYPADGTAPAGVLGYRGKVVRRRVRGSYTTLVAGTGGYEAARTPLGTSEDGDREYVGQRPSDVLYDGLSVLAGEYDGMEIPRMADPRISAADSEAVRWTRTVLELVAMVEEQAQVRAADLQTNVASAYFDGATETEPAEIFRIEEGRDTENGGVEVETADEERYARVVVWRSLEDGRHIPLTKPIRVDNRGRRVNPLSTFLVEMSAEAIAEGETPYLVGVREALRLGRNPGRVSAALRYPPFFLARGDRVRIVKREPVEGGARVAEYRVKLDTVPVENLAGTVAGEGELVEERFEEAERPVFPRPPAVVSPLWGLLPNGEPFVDTELPWVVPGAHPGSFDVDTEIAARYGVALIRQSDGSFLVTDEATA